MYCMCVCIYMYTLKVCVFLSYPTTNFLSLRLMVSWLGMSIINHADASTILLKFGLSVPCLQYTFDTFDNYLPGGGNGNPLQYSCLGNPMERGDWQATVHGVAKVLDTI